MSAQHSRSKALSRFRVAVTEETRQGDVLTSPIHPVHHSSFGQQQKSIVYPVDVLHLGMRRRMEIICLMFKEAKD